MLRVWVCSLLLCLTATTTLLVLPWPTQEEGPQIHDAPIVVIGSSLTRHAFPASGDDLLGDGRAYTRLSESAMQEDFALAAMQQLIAGGRAETLLVEAYPFVRDFKNTPPPQRAVLLPMDALQSASRDALRQLRTQLQRMQGVERVSRRTDDALDRPFSLRENVTERYPMRLRRPRLEAGLRDLLEEAERSNVEVLFLALPLSASASMAMGPGGADRLERHVREEAQRLDIGLLMPATIWPDRFFVDDGHLNRAGRTRVLGELRAAWKDRHGG